MEYFVKKGSIVREIWGDGDIILFIFAGAAAEFALNKAVDWLYHTGKLPADPLGRLFSTVGYAQKIVFEEKDKALKAIDQITAIHKNVETSRAAKIPDWAYRDVLFMLIDYAITAFEVLKRKLTESEKTEVFEVFNGVGLRMGISGLPQNFTEWKLMRTQHLEENLIYSDFSKDLYLQYKKNLGNFRYQMMLKVQLLIVPKKVKQLLSFKGLNWIIPIITTYLIFKKLHIHKHFRNAILPNAYSKEIKDLEIRV
jgi:hypothetical protein